MQEIIRNTIKSCLFTAEQLMELEDARKLCRTAEIERELGFAVRNATAMMDNLAELRVMAKAELKRIFEEKENGGLKDGQA